MSEPVQSQTPQESKPTDKEYNFGQLRKQLEAERATRTQLEERLTQLELAQRPQKHEEEDEEDSEPYVDRRRLKKELNRFGEQTRQSTRQEIQAAVNEAIAQERQQAFINSNPDFVNVMNSDLVQKFAEQHPELAKGVLRMPEGFERQQFVYQTIKTLGMDKPAPKQPSVQDQIDANRRSAYYQPSGLGAPPMSAPTGDFSPQGQKNAYENLKKLKGRLGYQ